MAQDPRRRMIGVFAVLAAVTLLLAAYTVGQWLAASRTGWSGISFNIHLQSGGAVFVVHDVAPDSPAERAGLRRDDRVTVVNGVPTADSSRFGALWRKLRTGDTVTFTVDGTPPGTVALRLADPLAQPYLLCAIAVNALAGLLFLAIGGFVYWKRSDDTRAMVFFFLCVLYGLLRLQAAGPLQTYSLPLQQDVLSLVVLIGLVAFTFPLLLHFCLVFPRRRPVLNQHPLCLHWLYGLPLALGGLSTALVTGAALFQDAVGRDLQLVATIRRSGEVLLERLRVETWIPVVLFLVLSGPAAVLLGRWIGSLRRSGLTPSVVDHPGRFIATAMVLPLWIGAGLGLLRNVADLGDAFGLFILLGLAVVYGILLGAGHATLWLAFPIAACVAVIRSYREAGLEERQQIRWPLWGVITGVAGYFFSQPVLSAAATWFGVGPGSPWHVLLRFGRDHLSALFLLLIPIAVAFAILKHRLMEINVYIRRTVTYAILTAVVGFLFLILVGGLGGLLVRVTGIRNEWVIITATLLVVAAAVPLRNRVQAAVDRRFFRRRGDYAATLRALSREMAAAGELGRLLRVVVDRLQEALQVRSVTIFLPRGTESVFRAVATVGLSDERMGFLRFPADGWLATGLEAVGPLPPSGLTDEERLALVAARAVLLAPVRHRGELRAILVIGGKLSDAEFEAEDTDFLAAATGQVAIGLEALLMEEQQREFEKAREIQQGLLPREIPPVPGFQIAGAWQPARRVGGDYYDVFDLGAGRLALVIADVSGKGLAAALLMSNLQAAVKAFSVEAATPRELCERVNRMICGHIATGSYITCFYGVLDVRARILSYVNAGHNPPLLWSPGMPVRTLEQGGTVLGLFRDSIYELGEVRLKPGDRLLLYTDGLSEAAGPADEEFGEARLAALLGAASSVGVEAFKAEILGAVTEFCGGEFRDDATLIVIQVDPA